MVKPPRASIVFHASEPRFACFAASVRRVLRTSLLRLSKHPAALGVFLVSDAEMRRINRRAKGKDRPTNVLSFVEPPQMPHPELPRAVRARGEIFLAPDFIARRNEDIKLLAVHGLLHLFGYTHGSARDRMRMERKERQLLIPHVVRGNRY
ncbi:MAG: rRNA maturation RNase YbeY [Candidatus Brennerbacteria bacterium]|nr:rRNA maturation RNase YbeY [Candidatus Brennerbacteria bacterium]